MAVPRGIKEQQLQRKRKPSLTKKDSRSSSISPEDPSELCNTSFDGRVKQSLLSETGATDKTNSLKKKGHVRKGSSSTEQHNEAYNSSGKETDETHVDKRLCKVCVKEKTLKRLPDDKRKWPLKKMDRPSLIEICHDLERPVPFNDIKVVAAYLGFANDRIERVTHKYSCFGGQGAAEDFLSGWVEMDPENHNVGKLLQILREERVGRRSAARLIEEWLEASNSCFGCGAILRADCSTD